jgi:2-dehydro-3-deoxygluconokinase
LVVTDGSEGSTGWTLEGKCFHVKPPSVAVRGTVGAGDAFTAGWLAGWIEGNEDWSRAMKWGNAVAAGAVELPGTSFPVRERVLELVREVE